MKLEEEIKVKQFQSSRHKLNVNLLYTYNWMVSKQQALFKQFGLTLQQYNILRILRGQHPKPCTIQLLKERMLDKQSDVSRLVDRLTKKNLVQRSVCQDDRRKMDVLISEDGLSLLAEMDPEVSRMDDYLMTLTDEEVDQLNALMDKLRG